MQCRKKRKKPFKKIIKTEYEKLKRKNTINRENLEVE